MSMTVADTILQQIRSIDYWALGAWGSHSFDKTDDALFFRVRGTKFVGKVSVHYHYASDLYIVHSYHPDGSVRGEYEDVFAEDLVQFLDMIIG